jgi:hypothetical protein
MARWYRRRRLHPTTPQKSYSANPPLILLSSHLSVSIHVLFNFDPCTVLAGLFELQFNPTSIDCGVVRLGIHWRMDRSKPANHEVVAKLLRSTKIYEI